MKRYLSLLKLTLANLKVYRVNILLKYFAIVIGLAVQFYLWFAVFENKSVIAEFTFQSILLYIFLSQIIGNCTANSIDMEMGRLIRNGNIIQVILKPLHFQTYFFFKAFFHSAVSFIFYSSPFLIIICIFLPISISIFKVAVFILSLLLAFTISVNLKFIIGLVAFHIKRSDALRWGITFLIQTFSGRMIPLSFFPDSIRTFINILPFKAIVYIPIQIAMDRYDARTILYELVFQIIWVMIFTIGARITMLATKRYCNIQGG